MDQFNHLIAQLLSAFSVRVLLALGVIITYYLTNKITSRWINKLAQVKQVSISRTSFILRTFKIAISFTFIVLFSVTVGIGYGDLSIFFSSVFAVLGVALVAQWSMLSNITASFLIFFVFPYRVGDRIKVVDKDEDISGVIQDIAMFHVLIRHENGNLITYPNSLMLQKGVIKLTSMEKPSTRARLYTRTRKR